MQYQSWDLVYNINKDGISYVTFYYKTEKYNPTLVIIEDTNGNVFGIYATERWHKSPEFYGTGESFLFTFKVNILHDYYQDTPYIKVYKWGGKQDLFLYSRESSIGAGGGKEFGIFIGDGFYKGMCGMSMTFDNDYLSDREFTVRKFEVWGINNH